MKNKFSTVFLIIFSFFLFSIYPSLVQGQNTPDRPSQTWRCLKWVKYSGKVKPGGIGHHLVTLTSEGFPANQDVYIVSCIDTAESLRCTTGSNDYDQTLGFGENNYTNLQNGTAPPLPFGFVVDGGSKRRLPEGKLEAIAASWTRQSTDHSFYGVTIGEAEILEGAGSSLQYGTFKFKQNTDKCTAVRWDPYGRVFDSQSLEPLPNITISILDQNKNRVLIPGNPQTTQVDGSFNFLVEPSNYLLSPNIPAGYAFNANPNLHPNYIKAYFDIYKPEEIISEKAGQAEHRDIPLDPVGTSPFRSEPTLINYGHILLEDEIKFGGKISHPLSIIALVVESTNQEIAKVTADKFGYWEIKIETKTVPQNEGLIPKITKLDLTSNQTGAFLPTIFSKLFKKVFAQSLLQSAQKKVVFQPILSYLEGYAYDEKNNLIPNAKVKVKLKMTDSVFYQTTADGNGFFSIAKENLPVLEYYLEFDSPKEIKPIQKTTAEFAQNNRQYLAANDINLMTATKKNQPVSVSEKTTSLPLPKSKEKGKQIPQGIGDGGSAEENRQTGSPSLIFLVLLLSTITGGGIFFYLKKKSGKP